MSDLFVAGQTDSGSLLDPQAKAAQLSKQVDWIITHRKQEYVSELLKLRTVKSVAIKRKIAKSLDKLQPQAHLADLKTWQSLETDRQTFVALESLIDRIERGALVEHSTDSNAYSVDEVIQLLKQVLGDKQYVVEGELGVYQPNYNSYAQFFPLKGSQDDALPCMVLKQVLDRLSFPFNEGLKLRLTGTFKLGKNSRLYFQVSKIELTGEGEFLRHLQELTKKLESEGLFDPARKRKPSIYPMNILLIASLNSAALTDFTKVMGRRRGGATIYHMPIKSQGAGAEEDIVQALKQANQYIEQYKIDTVVMTRGGGSQEELSVFQSERVVRALYAIHAPTIVAIGHERDTTLAELVADLRCSTPSQAAEQCSLSKDEVFHQVAASVTAIQTLTEQKISDYTTVNTQLWLAIVKLVEQQLVHIRNLSKEVFQLSIAAIRTYKQENNFLVVRFTSEARSALSLFKQQTLALGGLAHYASNKLDQTKQQIVSLAESIASYNPQTVLARGYGILRKGKLVVDSIGQVETGHDYKLTLSDGETVVRKP